MPAGSATDYLEKQILDLIFRNANASATTPLGLHVTNLWVGLFTTLPTDSSGGVEVVGDNYARVALARSGTPEWSVAAGTAAVTTNTVPIAFPTATGDGWGLVYGFGIFDAAVDGNLLYWGEVTLDDLVTPNPKTVSSGDSATFAPGALTIGQG